MRTLANERCGINESPDCWVDQEDYEDLGMFLRVTFQKTAVQRDEKEFSYSEFIEKYHR